MHDSFANFMKKEVMKYIKEEIDKGISIKQVKGALLKGGHNQDLIEEAILDLLKHNFDLKKAMNEPIRSKTLAQELYAEVLSSLVEYIEFQKKQGYTTQEIKRILLNYGHSEEILNNAVKAVEKGKRKDPHFTTIKFVLLCFFLVVFLLWVSASTNGSIKKILAGFFPSIASLLVIGLMVNRLKYKQLFFLWLVPFIFAGIFIVLGQSGNYEVFSGMKLYNQAILNVFISLIFAFVLISPEKFDEEPEPMSDLVKKDIAQSAKQLAKEEPKPQMQRARIKEFRPI